MPSLIWVQASYVEAANHGSHVGWTSKGTDGFPLPRCRMLLGNPTLYHKNILQWSQYCWGNLCLNVYLYSPMQSNEISAHIDLSWNLHLCIHIYIYTCIYIYIVIGSTVVATRPPVEAAARWFSNKLPHGESLGYPGWKAEGEAATAKRLTTTWARSRPRLYGTKSLPQPTHPVLPQPKAALGITTRWSWPLLVTLAGTVRKWTSTTEENPRTDWDQFFIHNIYVYVHMYICKYVYMYTCICISVYMYICTYVYM